MEREFAVHPQQAEIAQAAEKIGTVLATTLQDDALSNKSAFILAEVLKAQDSKFFQVRSFALEHLLNAYVGQALTDRLQRYLDLHEQLESAGATGPEHRRMFKRNEYSIYALPTQHHVLSAGEPDLGAVTVKALVLHTLEGNYLVVLNRRHGQWEVHFRQFWPDLRDELADKDGLWGLEAYRDAAGLTLLDVAKLSSAISRYADDLPGVDYPVRLSLPSFLKGRLIAGGDDESPGMQYGDGRDAGFVASLRNEWRPLANDTCSSGLPLLHVVAQLLHLAETPLEN